MASPNRQGATGGTTWRTTRLRLVWRPSYYHGVRKSSIWRPIRRNRARRAPYGDGHGRKTRAREKGRGKCRRAGKHRARGRLGARGERSAGEIRGQREERSQGRRTYLLARANAFARAAGRSCCRRGSASPSPRDATADNSPYGEASVLGGGKTREKDWKRRGKLREKGCTGETEHAGGRERERARRRFTSRRAGGEPEAAARPCRRVLPR